ncbi:acetylcholine receptor subunit alpha-like 1 [Patiria miniata]|uniref:Uncharacterized protein n=1 Tax=Patiria miniata TaxID=46514 RepID=A0A914BCE6_PATMI|nr:acetylcholine receptor subunit alpha-like 1 [Patiria miniata]
MAFRGGVLMVVLGLCLLYVNGGVGEGINGESRWGLGEHRLMVNLLSSYHPLVIPRTPVNVSYSLDLVSIDGVDMKEKMLRISAYAKIEWHDDRLQWDPSIFSGVSSLLLPADKVWRPDLKLYAQVLEEEDFNLRVHADGSILHYVPMRLAVPCPMQFGNYPFDVQTCYLRLESWGYDASMINLSHHERSPGAGLYYYLSNADWKVQSFTASTHDKLFVCCEEPYIELSFRIQVKRKIGEKAAYSIRVLAPSVLTSLLLLLCFLIPPRCGERITLCSVLLLCVLLQLFHLNLTVPITGPDAPFLADFLCFSVFLAFFAAMESVLSLNLSRCGSGSGNNNGRPIDGEEFVTQDKPSTGLMRIARFIDVGCFIVFTFIFAVAGGVILNPDTE